MTHRAQNGLVVPGGPQPYLPYVPTKQFKIIKVVLFSVLSHRNGINFRTELSFDSSSQGYGLREGHFAEEGGRERNQLFLINWSLERGYIIHLVVGVTQLICDLGGECILVHFNRNQSCHIKIELKQYLYKRMVRIRTMVRNSGPIRCSELAWKLRFWTCNGISLDSYCLDKEKEQRK